MIQIKNDNNKHVVSEDEMILIEGRKYYENDNYCCYNFSDFDGENVIIDEANNRQNDNNNQHHSSLQKIHHHVLQRPKNNTEIRKAAVISGVTGLVLGGPAAGIAAASTVACIGMKKVEEENEKIKKNEEMIREQNNKDFIQRHFEQIQQKMRSEGYVTNSAVSKVILDLKKEKRSNN